MTSDSIRTATSLSTITASDVFKNVKVVTKPRMLSDKKRH